MKDSQSDIIELCNKLNEATKLKRNGKSIKLTNFVSNTQIKLDSGNFGMGLWQTFGSTSNSSVDCLH